MSFNDPVLWKIVFKQDLEGVLDEGNNFPFPIEDRVFECPSSLLLIGAVSSTARPTWNKACDLSVQSSQFTFFSRLFSNKEAEIKRFTLLLGQLRLLQLPDYQSLPYQVVLKVPYWINQLSVEAYCYTGVIETENAQSIAGLSQEIRQLQRQFESNFSATIQSSNNELGLLL
jgi:hypothetical protein